MPSEASGAVTSEEASGLFIEDRIEVRGNERFSAAQGAKRASPGTARLVLHSVRYLYSASTRTNGKRK